MTFRIVSGYMAAIDCFIDYIVTAGSHHSRLKCLLFYRIGHVFKGEFASGSKFSKCSHFVM